MPTKFLVKKQLNNGTLALPESWGNNTMNIGHTVDLTANTVDLTGHIVDLTGHTVDLGGHFLACYFLQCWTNPSQHLSS